MKRRDLINYIIVFLMIIILAPLGTNANYENPPEAGSRAPNFTLKGYRKDNPDKKLWQLNDFKGSWTVLYFYPKDYTEGCTIEAKGFQKMLPKYKEVNAEIVGISIDSSDEHKSFCSTEDLGYTLLSDTDTNVSKLYGSWSKPYSARNTFLIDPDGVIKERWIGVKPLKHSIEVLDKLNDLIEVS